MRWFAQSLSRRFSSESNSEEVAVRMNRHAVFISVAGLQINCFAAYPTGINVLELGLLHVAPHFDKERNCGR